MVLPILAHDVFSVLSADYGAQAVILACWGSPLLYYLLAGVIWRKRRYWSRRWWLVACYYGVLVSLVGMFVALYRMQYSPLLEGAYYVLFGTLASPCVGLLLFVPPCRLPPPGHCLRCSYDLRAHAPGEKCPECGTLIATESARIDR